MKGEMNPSSDQHPGAKEQNSIETVLAYHRRTKHHFKRFAASPGYLDWATQPDPFRTYLGAERIELPLLADRLDAAYGDLYIPGAIPPMPLERNSVAMLFELALGLSAWKQYESNRWALRCNPSSGNLHPTEGYAILPGMPGLGAGVYHYVSRDHCLERRYALESRAAQQLAGSFPPTSFLVGLTSIHWREAWKYGERAFRYCQHDAGHAIATVRYAAALLGWSARLIADVSDTAIAAALGLNQPESFSAIAEQDREHPDALLVVGLPRLGGKSEEPEGIDVVKLRDVLQAGAWRGRANSLSPAHAHWPAIDAAAEATWQLDSETEAGRGGGALIIDTIAPSPVRPMEYSQINAAQLIKQRRSALSFDGITSISAETFYGMLDRLLPRAGLLPGTFGRGRRTSIVSSLCIGSGVYLQVCTSSSEIRRFTGAFGPRSIPTSSGNVRRAALSTWHCTNWWREISATRHRWRAAIRRSPATALSASVWSPNLAKAFVPRVQGGIESYSGKPACWGRCCTWRLRRRCPWDGHWMLL